MDCWSNTLSPYTLYFLEERRFAFCCSFFLQPQVDMALLELCAMNWDSLPTVISLNLEWFVCREEPPRAITWSLDSNYLPPPFNTPNLSPSTTCHPLSLLLRYYPLKKSCLKQGIIWVLVTTQWLLIDWCKFCLHSLRHWKATTEWLLKISLSLCASKSGFVKSSHVHMCIVYYRMFCVVCLMITAIHWSASSLKS